jgi:hypothetical protein
VETLPINAGGAKRDPIAIPQTILSRSFSATDLISAICVYSAGETKRCGRSSNVSQGDPLLRAV